MKATLNWIRVNPISRAHVNTTPTGNERSLERVRTDSKLCHEFFFREVFDNFLLYNFYLVNVKLGILLRCRARLLTSWIRERDFERDAQRVFFGHFRSFWWVSWPKPNAAHYQLRSIFSFWSIWQRFVKEILFVSQQIKYESFERKIAVARWRIVSSEKNTNEYIFVTSTKMRENSH